MRTGGAGLIGGALLEDAWQDHDEAEQEQGYQEGVSSGALFSSFQLLIIRYPPHRLPGWC